MKSAWIILVVLGLAAVSAFQFHSTRSLRREVRELRRLLEQAPGAASPTEQPVAAVRPVTLGALPSRVAELEQQVAALVKTSEVLSERGITPLAPERAEQMKQRFFAPDATDEERMRALRMMRRNGEVTEEIALQALRLAQGSTNLNTRRDLVRQLGGLKHPALKEPLLGMLGSETDVRVSRELVNVLGDFSHDPQVEQRLWDLAFNDPNENVREEAQDHLSEGRMTPERIASLKQKAIDSNLSLEARLIALKGLREANAAGPEVIAEMAGLAQNSPDPLVRAKLYDAFDGIKDPSLMTPLVHGLQDPSPIVRERAAEALSSFASDPSIQQWLTYVIQNDNDPKVKREAHQALERAQRRSGRR